jgi:hypothetical protein
MFMGRKKLSLMMPARDWRKQGASLDRREVGELAVVVKLIKKACHSCGA